MVIPHCLQSGYWPHSFSIGVWSLEAVVPMEYVIPSLRIAAIHCLSPEDSIPSRLDQLFHLNEARISSLYTAFVVQRRRQAWVNWQVKFKVFKSGD